MFATIRARPGPSRPVKTATSAAGGGFDGTEQAGTHSDSRKQGRNSADRCGKDRTLAGVETRGLVGVRIHVIDVMASVVIVGSAMAILIGVVTDVLVRYFDKWWKKQAS